VSATEEINILTYVSLSIFLLPLVSSIILLFIKKSDIKSIGIISSFLLVLASAISIYLFTKTYNLKLLNSCFSWFTVGEVEFTTGILLNFESTSMLMVVMVISAIVHIYSLAYMKNDEGYKRYYVFLGLFTFAMAGIVLANNLFVIFMFWELVGLSSYLLIGFWYQKESASFAARKAFIVNRIGDVGFIIGLAILFSQFATVDIVTLTNLVSDSSIDNNIWSGSNAEISSTWLTVSGICLFLGAVGKSAQFPLQVWLPDAMEGPTPVSALIHAATMVAAGVYLMIRVFPLLDITTLEVIAFTGALTAFMGAVAAMTQNDIKKVLAYSTISQLGYMLMGIGVGAYAASFFHLFTHAFFKAGLFLSAGSVIYALHKFSDLNKTQFDAQDMRNMGGLRKKIPFTFAAYVISSLALIGIPFFSGFLSKEALLSGAFAWAQLAGESSVSVYHLVPLLGFTTVVLTAIYMTRQVLLVFFGKLRILESIKITDPVIEAPWVIRGTIILLAVLSLGLVWSFNPIDFSASWFLLAIEIPQIISPNFNELWQSDLVSLSTQNHLIVSSLSIGLVIVGILLSYFIYRPEGKYASTYFKRPIAIGFFRKLSYYNWYLDPLYFNAVQQPVLRLSSALQSVENKVINSAVDKFAVFSVIIAHIVGWMDRFIIDGIVNTLVFVAGKIGKVAKSVQGSKAQNYIVIAILALLLIWFLII